MTEVGAAQIEKQASRSWRKWLIWGLSGLAGGLLLAKILFSLNIIWQIFNFAFQVDESEGMIVAETLLMNKGVDIFGLPTSERFIAAPYTPLYYLLNAPFLAISGPSFKPGRAISFLAFCGIAILLYLLLTRYSRNRSGKADWVAGGAAALFWGSLGLSAFWGGAVKPDILALFFSLSGVYSIYRYISLSNLANKWLYLSAGLFALAAMTKQTAFAGPLAVLVFLLFCVSLGAAARFLGVWLVLSFGPMLIMNILSRGGFWYHIVTVHELPWSSQNYWKFFSAFAQSYPLYLGLAGLFLIITLFDITKNLFELRNLSKALRQNQATLFVLYLGTSAGASLSAGTYGGNHNHLLELAAAICLCSGVIISWARENWSKPERLSWLYPVLLGLICLQTLGLFVGEGRVKPDTFPVLGSFGPTQAGLEFLQANLYQPGWLGLEYRVPPANLKEGLGQVAAFMTNNVGPLIYTDNVSLAIASGKPILTTDPYTQTHATELGRWDESYLLELINRKEFKLIVLRPPSIEERLQQKGDARDIYLSPNLARAILANYKLTQRNAAFIYEPK